MKFVCSGINTTERTQLTDVFSHRSLQVFETNHTNLCVAVLSAVQPPSLHELNEMERNHSTATNSLMSWNTVQPNG